MAVLRMVKSPRHQSVFANAFLECLASILGKMCYLGDVDLDACLGLGYLANGRCFVLSLVCTMGASSIALGADTCEPVDIIIAVSP